MLRRSFHMCTIIYSSQQAPTVCTLCIHCAFYVWCRSWLKPSASQHQILKQAPGKGEKKTTHFCIDPNAVTVFTCADVLINLFMRRTECSHCVNWHIYAFGCGGEKKCSSVSLKRGGGILLSSQRGNYCIYDHTKTHALREGDKGARCSGQGCSALLKGTSAVLWKWPGTSPATRPLFLSIWSAARDVNLRPPAQWADAASAAPTGQ